MKVIDGFTNTVGDKTLTIPLANDTQLATNVSVSPTRSLTQLSNFTIIFTPSGSDEWHVGGVHVVGRRGAAGGQDTCLLDWVATSTSPKRVFNASFPMGSQGGIASPPFKVGDGC